MRLNESFIKGCVIGAFVAIVINQTLNSLNNRLLNLSREIWELQEKEHHGSAA